MYERSSCSNTFAWPQSLQRHIKNKHKDDETVFKDITSPKYSDNSDTEHMDLDESVDDSTESESGDDSTESESGDDDNSKEDVWDDMILEVYNTDDYATKVSEYEYYQNAEENAKRDMLEVHTSDLKFNYYKLLLTYHRMQESKMHKKIMADVKKLHKRCSYRRALRSAIHYRNSMFQKLLEDDTNDEETDDERVYFEKISE